MNEPRTSIAKTTPGIWPSLALILMTAGVFWPAHRCEFVNYDDPMYVVHNEHIRTGLSVENAIWALHSYEGANWHPLTWLSLQLDASLYGLEPTGYHVTNIAVHSVNVALFFWILVRMTGRLVPSWCAAALWAIHPLRVQSVVWVTERKDVLSTLFWLLAILSYLRYSERQSWPRYGLVVLSLALSLLAKPMAVTLPCVLLLLDAWPLNRMVDLPSAGRLVREKLPFFVLISAYSVLVYRLHGAGGGLAPVEKHPLTERLAGAAIAYVTYLRELVWPTPLVALAPYVRRSWSEPAVWLAVGLLAAITMIVVRGRTQRPYALTGWLWYLGTLVPVIGIVHIGEHANADRYTYIPMMGIHVAICWWMTDLVVARPQFVRNFVAGSAIVALSLLALQTREQIKVWQTSETLWTHTLNHNAASPTAWCGLAHYQLKTGQYEKAIGSLRRAIGLDPRHPRARTELICSLVLSDRFAEADKEYLRTGVKSSLTPEQHYELGVKADEAGDEWLAIAAFAHVVHSQPENGKAHLGLARMFLKREHFEAAVKHFEAAEHASPELMDRTGVKEEFDRARRLSRRSEAP